MNSGRNASLDDVLQFRKFAYTDLIINKSKDTPQQDANIHYHSDKKVF